MKLKLSDVLENLAAGELSHLSLFENGADIPFETFNKRLLPIINAGLTDIHMRFFVKQKEVWVKHCCGDTKLVLDKKNAQSAHKLRGNAFIQDCDDPFKDDVVEILSIYNQDGQQYPLNMDTGHTQPRGCGCGRGHGCNCTPPNSWARYDSTLDYPATITTRTPYGNYGSCGPGLPVLYTPAVNVIRLPENMPSGFMKVFYKAAPARIPKLEDNGVTTYDRIDLDLPFTYLDALVYYISSRLTAPTNGGLQTGTNETTQYYNKYLSACAVLTDQGVDVSTQGSGYSRFAKSDFR